MDQQRYSGDKVYDPIEDENLWSYASAGNASGLAQMLKKGAGSKEGRERALGIAAMVGGVALVECLAKAGVDLESKNAMGWTPLMVAVRSGSFPVVQKLVELGCGLDSRDKWGRSALMWAAARKEVEIVKYLVATGSNLDAMDAESGFSALTHAVINNDKPCVAELLRAGASRDLQDALGETAMMKALDSRRSDLAMLLAEHGVDMDIADHKGRSVRARLDENGGSDEFRWLAQSIEALCERWEVSKSVGELSNSNTAAKRI